MKPLVTGAAVMLVAAGCSSSAEAPGEPGPRSTAEVVVENNNWMDVNVYAVRNGTRRRLGTVTTNQTRVFRLTSMFVSSGGEVQLLVDPIGSSQGRLMPPVVVMQGDRIEMNVFNHLPLSSISVLPRARW